MIKFNTKKFHPFKVEYVKMLHDSEILRDNCRELWIFGSTVEGASLKKHTASSDVDIAVFPYSFDLRDERNKKIYNEILRIFNIKNKYGQYVNKDIIWVDDTIDEDFLKEIYKGERIL